MVCKEFEVCINDDIFCLRDFKLTLVLGPWRESDLAMTGSRFAL